MTDVTLDHCRVRIVRQGGWSWGCDPQQLVHQVTAWLPLLLARSLADLTDPKFDLELCEPLRIRLRVRLEDLYGDGPLEVGAPESRSGEDEVPERFQPLAQRLQNALAQALSRHLPEGGETLQADQAPPRITDPNSRPAPPVAQTQLAQESLWPLLSFWHQRQLLAQVLQELAAPTLELWHKLLFSAPRVRIPTTVTAEFLLQTLEQLTATVPALEGNARALRLYLVVETASRLGLAPCHELLTHLLDHAYPAIPDIRALDPMADPMWARTPTRPEPEPSRDTATVPERPTGSIPAGSAPRLHTELALPVDTELHLASALPFLLLPCLARLGYLDLLARGLEALGLQRDAPLFAAALALKVLPPALRGTLHSPAQQRVAAAFAGLREPADRTRIAHFAWRATGLVESLDTLLAMALIQCHASGQPLLLQRWRQTWVLIEADGLFPIAAGSLDQLRPALYALAGERLLIPAACFEPEARDLVASLGMHWISDATPIRGERARTLQVGPTRYYSNDGQRGLGALATDARRLPVLAELGLELVEELLERRPVLQGPMEHHFFLASACALGQIAWTLWRQREHASPVAALTRFADLEARLRFERDRVTLVLPMGRRYTDLYQADLLGEVAQVPWLDGRPLHLLGG